MKFFIMSGGLPASRAAFERGSDQFAQVRDVLPERQQLAQGEEEEEEEQVTGQAAVAAMAAAPPPSKKTSSKQTSKLLIQRNK